MSSKLLLLLFKRPVKVIYIALLLLSLKQGRPRLVRSNGKVVVVLPPFFHQIAATFSMIYINLASIIPLYLQKHLLKFEQKSGPLVPELLGGKSPKQKVALEANKEIELLDAKGLKVLKSKVVEAAKSSEVLTKESLSSVHLLQLFDTLEEVKVADLEGKFYRGCVLRTAGDTLAGQFTGIQSIMKLTKMDMKKSGWGKLFVSQHRVQPVMFVFKEKYFFPFPIAGGASLLEREYRGSHTTAMVYDNQPVQDIFKRIKDGDKEILLGIYTVREDTFGWFTLVHDPSVPVQSIESQ